MLDKGFVNTNSTWPGKQQWSCSGLVIQRADADLPRELTGREEQKGGPGGKSNPRGGAFSASSELGELSREDVESGGFPCDHSATAPWI